MEPISGLVLLVIAAAAAMGCGSSWRESVSPNFKPRNPDADNDKRLSFGDFVLVDDGDGIYSNENPKDGWVANDQTSVSKTDPKLHEYLRSLGIDAQKMQRVPIKALTEYVDVFKTKAEEMGKAPDAATAIDAYGQIVKAADAAGIAHTSDSPLYERAQAAAGRFGCYIPLFNADEFSKAGEVADMEIMINSAVTCAKGKKSNGQAFSTRIVEIQKQGLKQAIHKLAELSWTLETLGSINEKMLYMAALATKNNIQDSLVEDFKSVALSGYRSVIGGILQREEVKKDTSEGRVDALEKIFDVLRGYAGRLNVPDLLAADVKKVRIEGYIAALDAIKKREGDLADAKVAKERLDAIVRAANERGIYADLRKQIEEAKIASRKGGKK